MVSGIYNVPQVFLVLNAANQHQLLLHGPNVVTYLVSFLLALYPQSPFLLSRRQNATAVRGSIRLTTSLALFPAEIKKKERKLKTFLWFCLFLPLHFPHPHAEPWLKTLRTETEEVGGGEKADLGVF